VILFSEKIAEKYFPETGRKKSPINIFSNQKPYQELPTEGSSHFFQSVRKQLSACKSGGEGQAS
jgi:hypothetical protein